MVATSAVAESVMAVRGAEEMAAGGVEVSKAAVAAGAMEKVVVKCYVDRWGGVRVADCREDSIRHRSFASASQRGRAAEAHGCWISASALLHGSVPNLYFMGCRYAWWFALHSTANRPQTPRSVSVPARSSTLTVIERVVGSRRSSHASCRNSSCSPGKATSTIMWRPRRNTPVRHA